MPPCLCERQRAGPGCLTYQLGLLATTRSQSTGWCGLTAPVSQVTLSSAVLCDTPPWLPLTAVKPWAAPPCCFHSRTGAQSAHSTASQQTPTAIGVCVLAKWGPLPKEGTQLRSTPSCLWMQGVTSLTSTCPTPSPYRFGGEKGDNGLLFRRKLGSHDSSCLDWALTQGMQDTAAARSQ